MFVEHYKEHTWFNDTQSIIVRGHLLGYIFQDLLSNEAPVYADFSPSEPHIIVCAGPGLGAGIYFFDLNLKRVSLPCL